MSEIKIPALFDDETNVVEFNTINKKVEKRGLEDAGHTILECSACQKPLIDIWVTNPKLPSETNFQATCCYCGDKSFVVTVKGGIHPAGIFKERQDGSELQLTQIVNIDKTQPDKVIFVTGVKDNV